MVATQVAVCVLLVTAAVMLSVVWQRFRALDVGYDAEQVVRAVPDWELAGTDPARQWALARQISDGLERRPEVGGAAAWRYVMQNYPPRPEFSAVFDGPALALGSFESLGFYYVVAPGTLEAMGAPLLRGRRFTVADGPGSPSVAVITRSGAEAWWPGEDPIGRRIKLGRESEWMTVVGVVDDVQRFGWFGRSMHVIRDRALPALFRPATQGIEVPAGWRAVGNCIECDGVMLAARAPEATSASISAATLALRDEIGAAAPDVPLLELGTLFADQVYDHQGQDMLVTARLAAAGGVVAILLALAGVVGVVMEGVARRTREIGIRVALGAPSARVLSTVGRESLMTAAAGAVLGLILAIVLHRALASTVFAYNALNLGADTLDLPVLAGAAVIVLFVTLAATLASARKALALDPMEALRSE